MREILITLIMAIVAINLSMAHMLLEDTDADE